MADRAELNQALTPSLLDRLLDDAPDVSREVPKSRSQLVADLKRMLDRLPGTRVGLRDRDVLLLGFAGAFRIARCWNSEAAKIVSILFAFRPINRLFRLERIFALEIRDICKAGRLAILPAGLFAIGDTIGVKPLAIVSNDFHANGHATLAVDMPPLFVR
jgi:hypothetical protein